MSRPIRAVLAVDEGLDSDDLVALFGGDESLRLAQVTRLDDAPRVLAETQADLLVVAAQGYSDRALFLIDAPSSSDPDRPVLVLGHGVAERLRPAGVRGRRRRHPDAAAVAAAGAFSCRRLVARRKARCRGRRVPTSGRLICVLGPKGGTGKTLTSANLGVALAQRACARVASSTSTSSSATSASARAHARADDLRPRTRRRHARRREARRLPRDAPLRRCACCSPRPAPTRRARSRVELLSDVYARPALGVRRTSSSTRRPASRRR